MRISDVRQWLLDQNINLNTISVAVPVDDCGNPAKDGEDGSKDPWFGTCDISGERGLLYLCTAATNDDQIVTFEVSTDLITGPLGKIAGCF